MERPQSIALFERAYLAAWAIGVINTVLSWSLLRGDPRVAQAAAMIGDWYMPTVTAIGLLIPLILWYFIARRGSVVAKWIMVVLTTLGVLGLIFSAVLGTLPPGTVAVLLTVLAAALNLYAATRLFQPDTKAWFGETTAGAV